MSGEGYGFGGYDNDGNPGTVYLPNGTNMAFTYDPLSRMKRIGYSNGQVNTFRYGGDGKRIERVENGETVRYVYDGDQIVGETDGAGNFTRYQLPGVSLMTPSGYRYYYRENALGSAVQLTGGTSNASDIASRTEYDGYGREFDLSPATDARGYFRFAGKHGYVTDTQSGMQMLGARYYLPALGRFLTQDPIGHKGGLNLYAYASNNPVNKVDPSGLADVYINYRYVSGPSWAAGYHAFFKVVDGNRSWSVSGGPANQATGYQCYNTISPSAIIDPEKDNPITLFYSQWNNDSYDYPKPGDPKQLSTLIHSDGKSGEKWYNFLVLKGKQIVDENVHYEFYNNNSNPSCYLIMA